MKTYFSAVISLFVTLSLSAQTQWLTHKDSVYNFTVQYPSDWQFKPPSPDARFFITSYKESEADNFRENINCIAQKLQEGITIQSAEKEILESLSKMPDFKVVRSGYSRWNGTDAFEIEYTCTQSRNETAYRLRILQKMIVRKNIFFTLTFTSEADSYNKYIETVRKVIKSFKVL